jgi:protease-4
MEPAPHVPGTPDQRGADKAESHAVPRRSGFSRLLRLLRIAFGLAAAALLVLFAAVLFVAWNAEAGLSEEYHSLARHGRHKVAIIRLEGPILEGEGFVKKQIDQVRQDSAVKAVVLRVNSPGGSVTAADYIYHHLRKLCEERKLPLVVSMGGMAASGGYYVSMAVGDAEGTLFAEPTTWCGSIGVIIPHYNVAELAAELGVEEDSIKSHPLKAMGNPLKRLSPEEQQIFQGLVDDAFDRFKQVVAHGRPRLAAEPGKIERLATGQVFTTRQALNHGLVDREGFIEDAIDRAIELAGLDKSETCVIRYRGWPTLLDLLLMSREPARRSELELLLDLTTPRAYYLCTWLPPLVRPGSQGWEN